MHIISRNALPDQDIRLETLSTRQSVHPFLQGRQTMVYKKNSMKEQELEGTFARNCSAARGKTGSGVEIQPHLSAYKTVFCVNVEVHVLHHARSIHPASASHSLIQRELSSKVLDCPSSCGAASLID